MKSNPWARYPFAKDIDEKVPLEIRIEQFAGSLAKYVNEKKAREFLKEMWREKHISAEQYCEILFTVINREAEKKASQGQNQRIGGQVPATQMQRRSCI